MRKKRPCRVCRKWFLPHARAGDRQKVCGSSNCQRERHRRACAQWHDRHPDYDREGRLRERLKTPEVEPSAHPPADPLPRLDWSAARDAVGMEAAVIVEETAKVLVSWTRDAVGLEVFGITTDFGRHAPKRARDALGRRPPPT